MRDPKLLEKLELRRLDAICVRQEAQIALMAHAIRAAHKSYMDGTLGHREIGELVATMQENGGHQMMALLSRLMGLYQVSVTCVQNGEYGKLEEAVHEVAKALEEGFYA